METYLLKSTVALCVLYTFYWLFLRKETFFGLNRMYLLSSLFVALLFPILNIDLSSTVQNPFNNNMLPIDIRSIGNSIASSNRESINILMIIYISGAVFFALRFVSKLSQIYYLYNRYPKVTYNGFKTVVLNGNHSPFTFFSILFLSRADYEDGKLNQMIVHEKAHRDQLHSLDIILLEITTIINWFNPFLWLFRLAIKSEHEYIADQKVIKEGFDIASYQEMLFEKSLGVTELGVTSNFNYSLLKSRLKMMTNKKSGSLAKSKYLIALPLLLAVCFFITTNCNKANQENVYLKVDVEPVYAGGNDALRTYVIQNTKYPIIAAELGVQARIFVQFVVSDKGDVTDVKVNNTICKERDKDGNLIDTDYKIGEDPKKDEAIKALEEEAIRVISNLGKFVPGKLDNKEVNVQFTFPITFILQ